MIRCFRMEPSDGSFDAPENRKLRTEEISYDPLVSYCSVMVAAKSVYVTLVAVRS